MDTYKAINKYILNTWRDEGMEDTLGSLVTTGLVPEKQSSISNWESFYSSVDAFLDPIHPLTKALFT